MHASVNRFSIGSDNGLSLIVRQAIIWTSAGLLLIGPLERNFSEILTKLQNFSLTKRHPKISFAKWRPFYPGGKWVRAWTSISVPHKAADIVTYSCPNRKQSALANGAFMYKLDNFSNLMFMHSLQLAVNGQKDWKAPPYWVKMAIP